MVLVLGAFAAVKLGGPGADVKSEALASPATSGAPVLEEPVVVPPNVAVRLLRVDTEPPGAVVKENGRQLCSTTPCRVALLGPDAATRHKLTIDKPGFKTAALDIDETQEKALAKLEFAMSDGPHVDAPAQPVAATEAPVVPPPAPTHLDAPVTAATVAGSVAPPPPPPVATAAPVAATGPMQFGEGMNRPTMLSGQNVVYSREALEAKVEGLILVKCTIQPDGAVNGCRIIRGLPFMDQPVLAAMATRRYTPILYQGKAIAVDYVFNIKLKLP
jgi:outer membrane biosynthesis protein TonB